MSNCGEILRFCGKGAGAFTWKIGITHGNQVFREEKNPSYAGRIKWRLIPFAWAGKTDLGRVT